MNIVYKYIYIYIYIYIGVTQGVMITKGRNEHGNPGQVIESCYERFKSSYAPFSYG